MSDNNINALQLRLQPNSELIMTLDSEVTLRDLFAAFALAGMLANTDGYGVTDAITAQNAYTVADVMLIERKKVRG